MPTDLAICFVLIVHKRRSTRALLTLRQRNSRAGSLGVRLRSLRRMRSLLVSIPIDYVQRGDEQEPGSLRAPLPARRHCKPSTTLFES